MRAEDLAPARIGLPNARALGELLPHWYKGHVQDGDPPGPSGYASLKAAAVALARTPERERRNVIEAYSWAYCDMDWPDAARASGLFLLLRVLFVVPEGDPASPLHADPTGRTLHVDPCCGSKAFDRRYDALREYDDLAARYRRRSPAEIDALEIR